MAAANVHDSSWHTANLIATVKIMDEAVACNKTNEVLENCEMKIVDTLCYLASCLGEFPLLECECFLTAYLVKPSEELYAKLQTFKVKEGISTQFGTMLQQSVSSDQLSVDADSGPENGFANTLSSTCLKSNGNDDISLIFEQLMIHKARGSPQNGKISKVNAATAQYTSASNQTKNASSINVSGSAPTQDLMNVVEVLEVIRKKLLKWDAVWCDRFTYGYKKTLGQYLGDTLTIPNNELCTRNVIKPNDNSYDECAVIYNSSVGKNNVGLVDNDEQYSNDAKDNRSKLSHNVSMLNSLRHVSDIEDDAHRTERVTHFIASPLTNKVEECSTGANRESITNSNAPPSLQIAQCSHKNYLDRTNLILNQRDYSGTEYRQNISNEDISLTSKRFSEVSAEDPVTDGNPVNSSQDTPYNASPPRSYKNEKIMASAQIHSEVDSSNSVQPLESNVSIFQHLTSTQTCAVSPDAQILVTAMKVLKESEINKKKDQSMRCSSILGSRKRMATHSLHDKTTYAKSASASESWLSSSMDIEATHIDSSKYKKACLHHSRGALAAGDKKRLCSWIVDKPFKEPLPSSTSFSRSEENIHSYHNLNHVVFKLPTTYVGGNNVMRNSMVSTVQKPALIVTSAEQKNPPKPCNFQNLMVQWIDKHISKKTELSTLRQQVLKLCQSSTSSVHLYLIVDLLHDKFGDSLLQLYVELYIQSLTIDINFIENARLTDPKEEIEVLENKVADSLCKLARFLGNHPTLSRECILSAFSISPSKDHLAKLYMYACKQPDDAVTPAPSSLTNDVMCVPCSGECHCDAKGECQQNVHQNSVKHKSSKNIGGKKLPQVDSDTVVNCESRKFVDDGVSKKELKVTDLRNSLAEKLNMVINIKSQLERKLPSGEISPLQFSSEIVEDKPANNTASDGTDDGLASFMLDHADTAPSGDMDLSSMVMASECVVYTEKVIVTDVRASQRNKLQSSNQQMLKEVTEALRLEEDSNSKVDSDDEKLDGDISKDICTTYNHILNCPEERLPDDLLRDLTIILDKPRSKILTWDLNWPELENRCKLYLEQRSVAKKLEECVIWEQMQADCDAEDDTQISMDHNDANIDVAGLLANHLPLHKFSIDFLNQNFNSEGHKSSQDYVSGDYAASQPLEMERCNEFRQIIKFPGSVLHEQNLPVVKSVDVESVDNVLTEVESLELCYSAVSLGQDTKLKSIYSMERNDEEAADSSKRVTDKIAAVPLTVNNASVKLGASNMNPTVVISNCDISIARKKLDEQSSFSKELLSSSKGLPHDRQSSHASNNMSKTNIPDIKGLLDVERQNQNESLGVASSCPSTLSSLPTSRPFEHSCHSQPAIPFIPGQVTEVKSIGSTERNDGEAAEPSKSARDKNAAVPLTVNNASVKLGASNMNPTVVISNSDISIARKKLDERSSFSKELLSSSKRLPHDRQSNHASNSVNKINILDIKGLLNVEERQNQNESLGVASFCPSTLSSLPTSRPFEHSCHSQPAILVIPGQVTEVKSIGSMERNDGEAAEPSKSARDKNAAVPLTVNNASLQLGASNMNPIVIISDSDISIARKKLDERLSFSKELLLSSKGLPHDRQSSHASNNMSKINIRDSKVLLSVEGRQSQNESLGVARSRSSTLSLLHASRPFEHSCHFQTAIPVIPGQVTELKSIGSTERNDEEGSEPSKSIYARPVYSSKMSLTNSIPTVRSISILPCVSSAPPCATSPLHQQLVTTTSQVWKGCDVTDKNRRPLLFPSKADGCKWMIVRNQHGTTKYKKVTIQLACPNNVQPSSNRVAKPRNTISSYPSTSKTVVLPPFNNFAASSAPPAISQPPAVSTTFNSTVNRSQSPRSVVTVTPSIRTPVCSTMSETKFKELCPASTTFNSVDKRFHPVRSTTNNILQHVSRVKAQSAALDANFITNEAINANSSVIMDKGLLLEKLATSMTTQKTPMVFAANVQKIPPKPALALKTFEENANVTKLLQNYQEELEKCANAGTNSKAKTLKQSVSISSSNKTPAVRHHLLLPKPRDVSPSLVSSSSSTNSSPVAEHPAEIIAQVLPPVSTILPNLVSSTLARMQLPFVSLPIPKQPPAQTQTIKIHYLPPKNPAIQVATALLDEPKKKPPAKEEEKEPAYKRGKNSKEEELVCPLCNK